MALLDDDHVAVAELDGQMVGRRYAGNAGPADHYLRRRAHHADVFSSQPWQSMPTAGPRPARVPRQSLACTVAAVFHTRMTPSWPADMMRRPSAEKATECTGPAWPRKTRGGRPPRRSHSFTWPSSPAEASNAVAGRECDRGHAAFVRLEGALRARGGGRPQPHRAGDAAAGDAAAARRHVERARRVALAVPCAREAARVRPPQPDAAVLARRRQQSRPARAGDRLGTVLAFEDSHGRRGCADVEQRHGPGEGCGGEVVGVAGEGQGGDRRLRQLERARASRRAPGPTARWRRSCGR